MNIRLTVQRLHVLPLFNYVIKVLLLLLIALFNYVKMCCCVTLPA